MAQTWTDNSYQLDHTGTTDLQAFENNLNTLKSLFSGATAPSNNVAGMPWFDTTNKLLKIRNNANSAWLGVMYGSTSTKIWIYANVAGDGWVVDGSVTDRVLAIKGGSQAYNVNGGNTAGTWTQPNHTLTVAEMPSHDHDTNTNTTGAHTHPVPGSTGSGGAGGHVEAANDHTTINTQSNGDHSHTVTAEGGGTAHNHGTTHRPAATVGTLQYPNV